MVPTPMKLACDLTGTIALIVVLAICRDAHAVDHRSPLLLASFQSESAPEPSGTISSEFLYTTVDHPELARVPELVLSNDRESLTEAEAICTEFLSQNPTGDVYLLRAAIRLDLKQPASAHADISAAVAAGIEGWEVHWLRSHAYSMEGRHGLAAREAELMTSWWNSAMLDAEDFVEDDWPDLVDGFDRLINRMRARPAESIGVFAGSVFAVFWLLAFLRGRRQRRDAGGSWTRLMTVAAVIALLWTLPVALFVTMALLDVGQPPGSIWFVVVLLLSALMAWLMMSPPNINYVGKEPLPLCEDSNLVGRIRHLAEALHVRVPRVRVQTAVGSIKDGVAAFVGGLAPFSVVVYDTVLQRLRTDEQDAVIGHELAHVANRSIRVYVSLFPLAACCGVAISFLSGGYAGFVSAIALRGGVFRAVSRWFEYDCDRRSALVTSPDAMARSLRRIHVGHALGRPSLMASLALSCSTHPSLDERVAALARLKTQAGGVTVPFDPRRVQLCRFLSWGFGMVWLLTVPTAIGWITMTGQSLIAVQFLHLAILTPIILLVIALRRPARINRRRVSGRWRWSRLTRRQRTFWIAGAVCMLSFVGDTTIAAVFRDEVSAGPAVGIAALVLSVSLVGSIAVLFWMLTIGGVASSKVPKLMREIGAALQRSDYEGVVKIAADNYKVIETDRLMMHNSSISLLATGHQDKAVELLEKLHRDHPWLPVTAITLIDVYLDQAEYERALDMAEGIRPELDPGDPLPLIQSGRALRGLGRFDDAAAVCKHAGEMAPDETSVFALQAMLALDRGDREEADRQIELGESLLPAEPLLQIARAEREVLDADADALANELCELRRTISQQPLLLLNRSVEGLEHQLAKLTVDDDSTGDDGPCAGDAPEC